ncbi:hypothetical protein MHPYR_170010 [uncultured Mycobacterium sp.]|uniref:Uncharacterized protein n=1 Tax=uncultured Mycobacterium sp. TaxID=171292 RepID=A0A1Y5P454_9MYCO|nr:hypothetical protein MHPYR_170010 [uncultured Mycobacterium sp.]
MLIALDEHYPAPYVKSKVAGENALTLFGDRIPRR